MKVFTLATELLSIQAENPQRKIAFIPTMGALHEGHLSLVENAQQNGYVTVVSIFINPLQFNNLSDLEKYPRTLEHDLALLEAQGVDFVFTPTNEEMYPTTTADVVVDLGLLDSRFEGACRPGHFHGVVQVVYRLFHYVQPPCGVFWRKRFTAVFGDRATGSSTLPRNRHAKGSHQTRSFRFGNEFSKYALNKKWLGNSRCHLS